MTRGRDAQRATEDMLSKARTEINSDRDRLRRELETARDQALTDLWNQSAQLATMISSKVVGRELNPDDHRRLLDQSLAELKQAAQARQRDGGNLKA